MGKLQPRLAWLAVYVAVNIIGAVIMHSSGMLIGDTLGNPLYSVGALWVAAIAVVCSYILILGPLFSFFSNIQVAPLRVAVPDAEMGARIGRVLLVLQIIFACFNLATGVNIAGSNTVKTDSVFAMFWVLVPVDILFFIYYGKYRDNKYFWVNALVWVVSNMLRGWAGMYLFILFFEWCRAVKRGRVRVKHVVITAILVVVLYPVFTNLKWLFRLSATGVPLGDLATTLFDNASQLDFFALLGEGVGHIVGRLQVTSLVVEVIHLRDFLQAKFAAGEFMGFWSEGLHGIIYDRLFSAQKSVSIGVAFTQYGPFDASSGAAGDWNTNIGYVGWFFIAPFLAPLYLAYTFFLAWLSFYLLKKLGDSDSARDMLWLAWLVYLLPPWFAVFTTFIYALFVFLLLKIALSRTLSGAPQATGTMAVGGRGA